MDRTIITALCCAALAGCVRESGSDYRTEAAAPATTSSTSDTRQNRAENNASETRMGSRLLPPPESISDPVITAKIRANIVADPALRGADVSVNTTQGVVNLTGVVASQEQAAMASAHAQRQDGVLRVDSHLAVNLQ